MLSEQVKYFLAKIDSKKKRTAYRSITEADETYFIKWVNDQFSVDANILADYIEFSKLADGLNHNGLFVYSLARNADSNVYDSNEEWRDEEELARYLFIADDSISWYCMELQSGIFYVLDKPSGEQMEQFASFNELLFSALEKTLS